MPKSQRLTLKITAEEAVHKFFLREMLFFFIKRRESVMLDSPFSFTAKNFSEYITEAQFSTTIGIYIDNVHIREDLKILRDNFLKRDKYLKIKEPRETLLKFSEEGPRDGRVFTIKDCPTEYINNALRYLDISLMLASEVDDKNRTEDLELERKIGSINMESLFGQSQDHKIIFGDRISARPLEGKEKAIFNILKNKFKTEVDYAPIYEAIRAQTRIIKREDERRGYVNDGIVELRKKLYEISGNPETIPTAGGRMSSYKLVY